VNHIKSFQWNNLASDLTTVAIFAYSIDKQRKLYCCFADVKEVLDTVNHQLLCQKLSAVGVIANVKLLKMLINIYTFLHPGKVTPL
jgi:hypothetical protein